MTAKTPFQIEIPRRATACLHGQEPFVGGMEYYSVLMDGPSEGIYQRQDYCSQCWDKLSKEKALPPNQSSWKSNVPLKKEASDLPKQRDARALYLLKEAIKSQEPADCEEAFVLSLYLARKRLMYQRQEIKLADGKPALIFEVAETEEMLCVRKIPLSELQVGNVQLELAKKFSG